MVSLLDDVKEVSVTHLNYEIEKYLQNYIFSNVDMLLDKCSLLNLDVEAIYEKIIVRKRGGYCFEHNKLFHAALTERKIVTTKLLARVCSEFDIDIPKTHRVNIVSISGAKYLVDVGFGAYTPDSLIPISGELTLCPNGRTYYINQVGDNLYSLDVLEVSTTKTLYFFDLDYYTEHDFDSGNKYSNTNPNSKHVNNVVLSKNYKCKTIAILNDTLITFEKGRKEKLKMTSIEDYRNVLKENFGIEISSEEVLILFDVFRLKKKN